MTRGRRRSAQPVARRTTRPTSTSSRSTELLAHLFALVAEPRGDVGALVLADLDLHRLAAERRVPGLERVLALRQAFDLELAVGSRDREVRMVLHGDVRVHPAVHAALELDDVARL